MDSSLDIRQSNQQHKMQIEESFVPVSLQAVPLRALHVVAAAVGMGKDLAEVMADLLSDHCNTLMDFVEHFLYHSSVVPSTNS